MLTRGQIDEAVGVLERFGLDALYVFGSHATGHDRSGSDVDLAALTRRVPPSMERIEIREELEACLGRQVDLVFLSDASPIVARQVVQNGQVVYEAHARRHAEFVVHMLSRYADLKRIRAPVEAALIGRMKDAG